MKHSKCAKITRKHFLKWIKAFFVMLTLLGFLIIVGTAGSSDLELISLKEAAVRSAIGLIMVAVGIMGQEVDIYRR